MTDLYYTPPTDEIFNEVRNVCMELWKEVDTDNDKFGYATGKINRIKDIANVSDNFMYMIAMFDIENQAKLSNKLSNESITEIRNRMLDGGDMYGAVVFNTRY